jgi:AraC-like DNA-binding protein
MDSLLTYRFSTPDPTIVDFVERFWLLENPTDDDVPVTVLPDGMIDLLLKQSAGAPLEVVLKGLDTVPGDVVIPAKSKLFAISFKLLAIEYLLQHPVSNTLNGGEVLTRSLWAFSETDIHDFDRLCARATQTIASMVTPPIDGRKKKLFDLIYSSHGALSVKELSEAVYWSSRQINRYFNQQFGVSLKAYCNILRFSASFRHISEGKLFPVENFADQNHFIKDIKRYAGVTPGELSRNKNNRFINITVLTHPPTP